MGQVAMSALGSSRACSPRPSPPTVHCSSQCPPIVLEGGGGGGGWEMDICDRTHVRFRLTAV